MIADVNLHQPDKKGDQRNYHAHILLTLRRTDQNGFTGNKAREWNKKENLNEWRKEWALSCSKQLERAGYEKEAIEWKYAYLTLKEQREAALARNDIEYAERCNHQAEKHKPLAAYQLEKRREISYVEHNRQENIANLKLQRTKDLEEIKDQAINVHKKKMALELEMDEITKQKDLDLDLDLEI